MPRHAAEKLSPRGTTATRCAEAPTPEVRAKGCVPDVSGYEIDDLILDLGRHRVTRGGSEISLPNLSYDLLVTLARSAPDLVSHDQLTERVWPSLVIAPETISQRVKLLRDALGDDAHAPRYIAGTRGRGYRMVAAVRPLVRRADTHTSSSDSDNSYGSTTSPPSALPGDARPVRRLRRRLRRRFDRVLVAILAVLAVGLAYVVVDRFWISRHSLAGSRDAGTVSVVAFNPPPHSIAVLPFANMSGDKDQEYFSDGLSEELLNSLVQIIDLQVAARTSSFYFKREHADLATIAHKLNVASVLEGSVRVSGHTVRITAQLNNAVTGFHIWSATYDRDLSDVLKVQAEIAAAVASALKVKLLGDAAARIELGGTRNPAALDAYLRGRKPRHVEYSGRGLQASITAFSEAIELDPNYALAFADRSLALANYAGGPATGAAVRESYDRAQSDALKATALAPGLPEGHLALAVYFENGALDFTRANEEYKQALTLAPGNARVLRPYGLFAVLMGRQEEGLAASRRAVVLDPLNPHSHGGLALALREARRYEEAVTAFEHALALDPENPNSYGLLGIAYYSLGNFQKARESCEMRPEVPPDLICLALTYDRLGRHADAEAALASLRHLLGDAAAYQYAQIYAQWGDRPKGLEWLDITMRLRDPGLIGLKSDPLLDPLRNEPRFQTIERALKFP